MSLTTSTFASRLKHRRNLTLYVLTSVEHRIRRFSIHGTHGLLIHCNEIRRRHLRDLIFRTTTTTQSVRNHSSMIVVVLPSDILLSVTIVLIFYKNT